MNDEFLALKPYLESVKEICGRLSQGRLTGMILGLAQAVPVRERRSYLQTIESLAEDRPSETWDEGIPGRIETLQADIGKRLTAIEVGSTYEDGPFESREWEGDEELPAALSEEQKQELEAFFQDAAHLFLGGELRKARTVYRLLFELLDGLHAVCEEHAFYVPRLSPELHLREARARYCRCVYETTSPSKRARAMLGAMEVDGQLHPCWFDVFENNHPMLRDVMDARPGELSQFSQFLSDWITGLEKKSSARADMLLLEAVFLGEGLEALASRVRSWGGRQPRAWLFWIRLLALAEDWKAAAAAAEEALAAVEHPHFRAQIAGRLVEAGGKINRPALVLAGLREAFRSLPGKESLLRLLDEAERQNLRAEELEKALGFARSLPPDHPGLLVKILLMAGKAREAFEMERDTPALGWSFTQSAGAVVFAGILSLLCLNRIAKAATVQRLLRRHADTLDAPSEFPEGPDLKPEVSGRSEPRTSVSEEILTGLRSATTSPEEITQYRLWAMSIGRRRVEQIVGAKHRGAYDRAAEVLAALAECCVLNGDEEGGRDLIDEYRNRKFNRYPAFRGELDRVLACSSILQRSIGISDS
jgi:hypothetical protein